MSAAKQAHVAAMQRLAHVSDLAASLAHAFRDKLDFSDPKDYDKLAEYAFNAAEGLTRKSEALVIIERDKYEEALVKENKAIEAAAARQAQRIADDAKEGS
jgi:hypothetical protein